MLTSLKNGGVGTYCDQALYPYVSRAYFGGLVSDFPAGKEGKMSDFPNQEKMTKQEMVDYLKRWHVYWTTMVMRTPLEFRESEEAFNAIRVLIGHGPVVNEENIELEILKTERSGYEAENQRREQMRESPAYGEYEFQALAERMRALKTGVIVKKE